MKKPTSPFTPEEMRLGVLAFWGDDRPLPTRRHQINLAAAFRAFDVLGAEPVRFEWLLEPEPRITLLGELGRFREVDVLRELAGSLCHSRPSAKAGEKALRDRRRLAEARAKGETFQVHSGPCPVVVEELHTRRTQPAWIVSELQGVSLARSLDDERPMLRADDLAQLNGELHSRRLRLLLPLDADCLGSRPTVPT